MSESDRSSSAASGARSSPESPEGAGGDDRADASGAGGAGGAGGADGAAGMSPGREPIGSAAQVLIVLAVLLFIYLGRHVLLPFVMAAALAYISRPLMHWIERRSGMPHWLAALSTFAFVLGVLIGLGYWGWAVLVPEAMRLMLRMPQLLEALMTQVLPNDWVEVFREQFEAAEWPGQWTAYLREMMAVPTIAASVLIGSLGVVVGLFLTFVLLFYFLLHGHRLLDAALWVVPPRRRARVKRVGHEVNTMLARYVRGLVVIVLITFALTWLGTALLLQLPQPTALAAATAILEPLPVIGPVSAALLLGLMALERADPWVAMGYVAFIVLLRLVIDQIVAPLVLGQATRLHPVVVLFAFVAGGLLFGIIGLLLAVPVTATTKIILTHVYESTEPSNQPATPPTP